MTAAVRRAVPAQFDRSAQHLRGLIAKVHIARKDLALDEDTYRGVLFEVTGHMSAKDCNESELERLVDHFKTRGFRPRVVSRSVAGAKTAGRRLADHPSAKKARALWLSLYNLGAIKTASEAALETFAKRQLKVLELQWADQSHCDGLIEALKAMAEREGWSQKMTGPDAKLPNTAKLRLLTMRLCQAIVAKLKAAGVAAEHWTLAETVFHLCGDEIPPALVSMTREDFLHTARILGAELRKVLA